MRDRKKEREWKERGVDLRISLKLEIRPNKYSYLFHCSQIQSVLINSVVNTNTENHPRNSGNGGNGHDQELKTHRELIKEGRTLIS